MFKKILKRILISIPVLVGVVLLIFIMLRIVPGDPVTTMMGEHVNPAVIEKISKEMGLDKNTVVIFASDHGETMCSQRTDDPKNSPYSESMNIPFLVRFPDKIQPRVDDLLLSAPDIMPTVLGLCGLGDSIPAEVQGRNFAPLFFDEKAEIVRPTGALYIQNIDGEKDENGLVKTYFPSSRGIKTADYTLALYIDRKTKQLKKSLLFNDAKDPYQLNNLPLEENKEIVAQLYREMGAMLKEINDPWYTEKNLSDKIPY